MRVSNIYIVEGMHTCMSSLAGDIVNPTIKTTPIPGNN